MGDDDDGDGDDDDDEDAVVVVVVVDAVVLDFSDGLVVKSRVENFVVVFSKWERPLVVVVARRDKLEIERKFKERRNMLEMFCF